MSLFHETSGGRFIWADKPWLRVVKDKDVLTDVAEASSDAVGYCSTDVWGEARPEQTRDICATTVYNLDGLRFALACLVEKQADVRAKFRLGEPLLLGTSYPQTLSRVLGQQALPPIIRGGTIEGLPVRLPALDGIFEIVKSGASLRANGLVAVVDGLEEIRLMEIRQIGAIK